MNRIKVNSRLSNIVAAGMRAHALATERAIGDKLPEGLLDSLYQDLTNLSVLIPGTDDARTGVRALTGKQMDACTRAYRRVAAMRRTVVRQTKSLDARRAYGVGERLSVRVVRDIVHALRVIIGRIEAEPAEATSYGFGAAHLEALKAMLADVGAVDTAQEKARVARPLSTRDRNAAARRVVKAVGVISDTGAFLFVDDDAKRSEFEALASRAGRPPKMPSVPGGESEAAPAAAQPVST